MADDWFALKDDKAPGLLIDYYNMLLEITEEDGKFILSDKEFAKITTFFKQHRWLGIFPPITAKDFDEKFPHPWSSFERLKAIYHQAVPGSEVLTRYEIQNPENHDRVNHETYNKLLMLLNFYTCSEEKRQPGDKRPPGKPGVAHGYWWRVLWRESKGFQEFLSDYQRITTIVRNAVEKQSFNRVDMYWIQNLGQKLQMANKVALADFPKGKMSTEEYGETRLCETIDLRKLNIVEGGYFPDDWYSSDFGRLVYFIYRGLLKLLRGEVALRRCEYPHCDKIFAVSEIGKGKERKWCSTSCRVKGHHRRKNEKK